MKITDEMMMKACRAVVERGHEEGSWELEPDLWDELDFRSHGIWGDVKAAYHAIGLDVSEI